MAEECCVRLFNILYQENSVDAVTLGEKHRFFLSVVIHKNYLMIKTNFFITDIELGFLPWLVGEVDKTMEHGIVARTLLDSKSFHLKGISEMFQ